MKNLRLVDSRKKQSLTQREVAQKAGTTERAYQYYEAGMREPSARIAVRIARAVGSTVEEIFG